MDITQWHTLNCHVLARSTRQASLFIAAVIYRQQLNISSSDDCVTVAGCRWGRCRGFIIEIVSLCPAVFPPQMFREEDDRITSDTSCNIWTAFLHFWSRKCVSELGSSGKKSFNLLDCSWSLFFLHRQVHFVLAPLRFKSTKDKSSSDFNTSHLWA